MDPIINDLSEKNVEKSVTNSSLNAFNGELEDKLEMTDKSEVIGDLSKGSNNVEPTIPTVFKKPVLLIGPRRGKSIGKIRSLDPLNVKPGAVESYDGSPLDNASMDKNIKNILVSDATKKTEDHNPKTTKLNLVSQPVELKVVSSVSPAQKIQEQSIPLNYKEPRWGGMSDVPYHFEVLKSGKILEDIDLSSKSLHVFGRLSTCDIHLAHPTISRYHAVLQYRVEGTEHNPQGFYIYDLGSTHGTFLNKNRIVPNLYVRVQVGHMLKLGCSSRMLILQGPPEDMEEESELTVTQLKEKRILEEKLKEQEMMEAERLEKEREPRGIDWGMGEDADEETDLSENPFAATNNEDLYIDDPKKSLRGWFERENHELEYDVQEKSFGQFLCRVELPVDSARGGCVMAEAIVKGKKKEAVAQCALEACRILDRYGLLRQSNHESKKRKVKNWEDEDFYDSDEDPFLDQTGAIEKKRHMRMKAAGKLKSEVDTYDSLLKKHQNIVSELNRLEVELAEATRKMEKMARASDEEEDALDSFMNNLSSEVPDKKHVSKLKSELLSLKQDEHRLRKLVNIAKPVTLPDLLPLTRPASVFNKEQKLLVEARRKVLRRSLNPSGEQRTTGRESSDSEFEEEDDEETDEVKLEEIPSSGRVSHDHPGESSKGTKVPEEPGLKGASVAVECITDPAEEQDEATDERLIEKRKRRNKRRLQQRKEKAFTEKLSRSEFDSSKPDYSTWVPPQGQSGDGRTRLNDKFGY